MGSDTLSEALRETLAVFETAGGAGEPMTTSEVTGHLDVSRRSIYTRLEKLVERGCLETKKVGAKGRVWWLSPERDDDSEHLPSLVDGVAGVLYRCRNDENRPMEFVGGDCERLTGYEAESLRSGAVEWVDDVVHPKDAERARAVLRTELGDDDRFSAEYRIRTADGETRWVAERGRVASNGSDGPELVEGLVTDITAVKAERRRVERGVDDAFERIDDAFYAVDEEFRFTYVNERAEELLRRDEAELLGENHWDVFPFAAETDARDCFREAIETREPARYELDAEGEAFPVEVTVYPSDTGLSVYFYDASDRRAVESDLRESERMFRTLAENLEEVVWMATEDPTEHLYVNPSYERVWGRDRENLYENGFDFLESIHPEDRDRVREAYTRLPEDEYEEQFRVVQPDGSVRWVHAHGISVNCEDNDDHRIVGIGEDATDRIEQRRELQRRVRQQEVITEYGQRALEDRDLDALMSRAVSLVAETLDNDYCEILDFDADADELRVRQGVGPNGELAGSATVSAVEDDSQVAYTLTSDQPVVVEDFDTDSRFGGPDHLAERGVESGISVVVGSPTDPWGVLCTFDTARTQFSEHDVNFVRSVANVLATAINRRAYERALVTRRTELQKREGALRRAYGVIADPALSLSERIDELLEVVRGVVGTDSAMLSRAQDGELVFEALDIPDGADLRTGDSVPLDQLPNCEHVVSNEQTLAVEDVARDAPEFADSAWDVASYLGAPVVVDDEVYGTFCFYDTEPRAKAFSEWEVTFVDILSNWVGNELERGRDTDRLAALNSLNEVVRETTKVVIEQSTREEIEQTVCERLADTDSYLFAWVGDIDLPSQTVGLRAEAGVEWSLDGEAASAGPNRERGEDPTSEAIRTGEVQILQNVRDDPEHESWRETAERYGFDSSAAVPIVHEGTVYGALNVYADRPRAFGEHERAVISQLGEIVGHAIAAVERKQALMSNEVVELEFRVADVFDASDDAPTAGAFTLDEAVSLTEGEFLLYGTATEDATDTVSAFVEVHPYWEEVTFRDDGRFEIRLSNPPILSTLASLGGSIEEAIFENGILNLTLHISPRVDARRLIDVIRDGYPSAEMVTKRQVELDDSDAERVHETFVEGLTDRQRAALRAAYHAGFFEWPREASGQEMAASLDVSAPTFHQHLRTAEKKVLDSLLSSSVGGLD